MKSFIVFISSFLFFVALSDCWYPPPFPFPPTGGPCNTCAPPSLPPFPPFAMPPWYQYPRPSSGFPSTPTTTTTTTTNIDTRSSAAGGINTAQDYKDLINKVNGKCTAEWALTDAEVNKVRMRDYSNPSKNLQCFTNCFQVDTGTFNGGKVIPEVSIARLGLIIGADNVRALLDKCFAQNLEGNDICETAYNWYRCFDIDPRNFQ